MSDSSERKTKEATQQKLRKSRRDGNVPQGRKVVTLFVVSAVLGAVVLSFGTIGAALSQYLGTIFTLIGQPVDQIGQSALNDMLATVLVAAGPFVFLAPAVAVLVTIAYNRGIPFSIKPIVPDFSRMNPAEGLKRMFGKRSFIEALTGFVQILIWTIIAYFIINPHRHDLFKIYACGLPCMEVVTSGMLRDVIATAIALMLVYAVIEVVLQQSLYNQDQKMTSSEYKREIKDSYGAPEIRRARARLQHEERFFSTADPDVAHVDMANMCFYSAAGAVAIRYHPEAAPIPYICATATGEDIKAMRNRVRENGFKELKSRRLVDGCISYKAGMPVPRAMHEALTAGLMIIFN